MSEWVTKLDDILGALAVHFKGLGYQVWPTDVEAGGSDFGFGIGRFRPGIYDGLALGDRWNELSRRVSVRLDGEYVTVWTSSVDCDVKINPSAPDGVELLEAIVLRIVGEPVGETFSDH